MATILFGILAIYIVMSLVHGNTTFGFRIPFIIKVHSMEVNDTYLNSLLFNCNLMLLGSTAINFLALWCFPEYLIWDRSTWLMSSRTRSRGWDCLIIMSVSV